MSNIEFEHDSSALNRISKMNFIPLRYPISPTRYTRNTSSFSNRSDFGQYLQYNLHDKDETIASRLRLGIKSDISKRLGVAEGE